MFFDDKSFLKGKSAKKLYKAVKSLPIIDYHSHVPAKEIFENRRFDDVADLFLCADHYKWRLMRAAGVPENLITGDGTGEEKFRAFAGAIDGAANNPVYHWTHLELKRCFGINEPLNSVSADRIRRIANEKIKADGICVRSLIEAFNVKSLNRYSGISYCTCQKCFFCPRASYFQNRPVDEH